MKSTGRKKSGGRTRSGGSGGGRKTSEKKKSGGGSKGGGRKMATIRSNTKRMQLRPNIDRNKLLVVRKEPKYNNGGFYDAVRAAAAAAKGFIWKKDQEKLIIDKAKAKKIGMKSKITDGMIVIGSKMYIPTVVSYSLKEVKDPGSKKV